MLRVLFKAGIPLLSLAFFASCNVKKSDDLLLAGALALVASGNGASAPFVQKATGGNREIILDWSDKPGASSCRVYWSTSPGVTPETGSLLSDVASPYAHTGLSNGTDYYYIVAAVVDGTEKVITDELTAYPYLRPLKTFQTKCWDATGTEISCSGTGQDGELQKGRDADFSAPTAHPTYTADSTITDHVTGLVWKTCSEGFVTSDCTGPSTTANFATARTLCSDLNSANSGAGYAGRRDWRLPTIEELETTLDYSKPTSVFNTEAYPGTSGGMYWSDSISLSFPSYVRGVIFDGTVTVVSDTESHSVRCVSGS